MSNEPERVPRTPIVVNGRLFDPSTCVHGEDYSGDADGQHHCVHDWRVYWGNQNRGS